MLMGSITESGQLLYRRRLGTCGRTSAPCSLQRIVQTGDLPDNSRRNVKCDIAGINAQTRKDLVSFLFIPYLLPPKDLQFVEFPCPNTLNSVNMYLIGV